MMIPPCALRHLDTGDSRVPLFNTGPHWHLGPPAKKRPRYARGDHPAAYVTQPHALSRIAVGSTTAPPAPLCLEAYLDVFNAPQVLGVPSVADKASRTSPAVPPEFALSPTVGHPTDNPRDRAAAAAKFDAGGKGPCRAEVVSEATGTGAPAVPSLRQLQQRQATCCSLPRPSSIADATMPHSR